MADEGTWFNCLKKLYLSQCRPRPRLNTGVPGRHTRSSSRTACMSVYSKVLLTSFALLADCNEIMIYLKRLGFPTIYDGVFFSVI